MSTLKILLVLLFLTSCREEPVINQKDMGQNMMDLKLYQENLGDYLRRNDLSYASWLLEDMDSILHLLSQKFEQHRKMEHPFSYYYKRRMKEPISGIRRSIRDQDSARALEQYRILVKRCNKCHEENDIDKQVRF